MRFLSARFALARGDFTTEVEFDLPARGAVSLFGASGAGKTTLLRCLAGLEPRARGRLVVGGETWQDDAARVFVPAWRRAVGYVTQDAGLFPHLDVRGNLRFGERRVPSAERRLAFADVVAWLGLEPLLGRRPDSLSGGERQRVAIGRALLASPRLLLLDEPLSALDAANRTRILPYLETLPPRLSAPVVFVSHSLQEVARLCEHMVWLEAGRIRASGPVHELLPQVDASTEDEGLSAVLAGRVLQHDPVHELTEVAVAGGTLFVRRLHAAPGAAVRVQILARDVSVALDPELRASILNVLRARIVAVHAARGRAVLRLVTTGGAFLLARITTKSLAALGLAEGTEVYARMKSVGVVGGAGPDG